MRLGGCECKLKPKSLVTNIYGKEKIVERHRHRYEVNANFIAALEEAGLNISGYSQDDLVEVIELKDHQWFLGCQFHPEFTSNPRDGHPLFIGFVEKGIGKAVKNL